MATDIGGTFTDLVYYEVDPETGAIEAAKTAKTQSTPPDFEVGVMGALEKEDVEVRDVEFFAHGTTVVINALTERKGVRTGLITTRGFRDVLEIGRGNRPDFFNLRYSKPAPFVPRFLRKEITERVTHSGDVHTPLAVDEVAGILETFRQEGVEAIAVCLLHAYANPSHEQLLEARIREAWPEVTVAASHRITREWREYERTSTTVLSAYVQPIAAHYLDRLKKRLTGEGFHGALYIMQSNGGIDTVEAARSHSDHDDRVGTGQRRSGRGDAGQVDGRAQCDRARHRWDHGQVLVDRHRPGAGDEPVHDREKPNLGRLPGDDSGCRHRRDRETGAGASPGSTKTTASGSVPAVPAPCRDRLLTDTVAANRRRRDAHLLTGRIDPGYFFGGEITADMGAG